MFSTSFIDFPLYFISKVSLLNLFDIQLSHSTYTSGRKFISINFRPPPLHSSQRPPCTLKLNLPGLYPLITASVNNENKLRISV